MSLSLFWPGANVTVRDIIARIRADLDRLEAMLPAEPVDDAGEADGEIDTHTASARYGLPLDTCRWLAREKFLGEKRGGRWVLSEAALRRYLAERE